MTNVTGEIFNVSSFDDPQQDIIPNAATDTGCSAFQIQKEPFCTLDIKLIEELDLLNKLNVDDLDQEHEILFPTRPSSETTYNETYNEIRSVIGFLSKENEKEELAASLTAGIIRIINNTLQGFGNDIVGALVNIVVMSSHITVQPTFIKHDADGITIADGPHNSHPNPVVHNVLKGWHVDTFGPMDLEECDPKATIFTLKGPSTEFLQIPLEKREEFLSLNNDCGGLVRSQNIADETLLEQLTEEQQTKVGTLIKMIKEYGIYAAEFQAVLFRHIIDETATLHRTPPTNQKRVFFRIMLLNHCIMEKIRELRLSGKTTYRHDHLFDILPTEI